MRTIIFCFCAPRGSMDVLEQLEELFKQDHHEIVPLLYGMTKQHDGFLCVEVTGAVTPEIQRQLNDGSNCNLYEAIVINLPEMGDEDNQATIIELGHEGSRNDD